MFPVFLRSVGGENGQKICVQADAVKPRKKRKKYPNEKKQGWKAMKKNKDIFLVAGARPNFMKIAPIYFRIKRASGFRPVIVHTGQHYDSNMSGWFFRDLGLPDPDISLRSGSASHAVQTAKIMVGFEKLCALRKPALIVVVGDVNSTLACAVVGSKLHIPIAHVEAGLRSFDRAMPEEINRVVTDALSSYHFTTCRDAEDNLRKEGISRKKIFFVGNVMIDTLLRLKKKSERSLVLNKMGLKKKEFAVLTLHRPGNVDEIGKLEKIISIVEDISKKIPVVFPAHPRTAKKMKSSAGLALATKNIIIIPPLGYLDFIKLVDNSKLVVTDSGGIQEETTALGVPCLTLRENTERPVTVREGTNILCGISGKKIMKEVNVILAGRYKKGRMPELWDGKAAERIIGVLKKVL
jgi:UDP-N-acetylglucosamine 2-epimerase (non-hydrolysing)